MKAWRFGVELDGNLDSESSLYKAYLCFTALLMMSTLRCQRGRAHDLRYLPVVTRGYNRDSAFHQSDSVKPHVQ